MPDAVSEYVAPIFDRRRIHAAVGAVDGLNVEESRCRRKSVSSNVVMKAERFKPFNLLVRHALYKALLRCHIT